MARVQTIKTARASKEPRICATCRHEVAVGETYRKLSKRFGPTLFWCSEHQPKESDLLTGRHAELAAIVEGLEEDVSYTNDPNDIRVALESADESLDTFIEDLEQAMQSLEDGFGHSTAQTENMAQTITDLQDWKADLSNLKDEIDTSEENDPDEHVDRDWDAEVREKLAEVPELQLTA